MNDRKVIVVAGIEEAPGIMIGVDLTRFEVPPKSRIPSGVLIGVEMKEDEESEQEHQEILHFVNVAGEGVWLQVKGIEVLSWDRANEVLVVPSSPNEEQIKAYFETNSGAQLCEYKSSRDWYDLANFITPNVLSHSKIPLGTKVLPGNSFDEQNSATKAEQKSQVVPYFSDLGRVPQWSALVLPSNEVLLMSASQRTTFGFDSSQRLEWILKHNQLTELDLIGEYQLAFVTFILLNSQPALEQWKNLLKLFCSCGEQAIKSKPMLFQIFLNVTKYQFLRCDLGELLSDKELSQGCFIESSIKELFETISLVLNDEKCKLLKDSLRKFRAIIAQRCGFDPGINSSNAKSIAKLIASGEIVCEDGPIIVNENGIDEIFNEFDLKESQWKQRRKLNSASSHSTSNETASIGHQQRRNEIENALDSASERKTPQKQKKPHNQGPLSFSMDE